MVTRSCAQCKNPSESLLYGTWLGWPSAGLREKSFELGELHQKRLRHLLWKCQTNIPLNMLSCKWTGSRGKEASLDGHPQ